MSLTDLQKASFRQHIHNASQIKDDNGNAIVTGGGSASAVTYDHTTSHLAANNVQAAIDEVVANPIGKEYAYAEITGIVTITSTTQGTPTDTGLSITFTADGTTKYAIEFFVPWVRNWANGLIFVDLWADSARLLTFILAGGGSSPNEYTPGGVFRRYLTPSAGSHTYQIKGYVATGNGEVGAGTGSADYAPAFLRAVKA